MKANLIEVMEILKNINDYNMEIKGIVYENKGNTDYVKTCSFRAIDFYLLSSELGAHCRNTSNQSLSVFVSLSNSSNFYKIIR